METVHHSEGLSAGELRLDESAKRVWGRDVVAFALILAELVGFYGLDKHTVSALGGDGYYYWDIGQANLILQYFWI